MSIIPPSVGVNIEPGAWLKKVFDFMAGKMGYPMVDRNGRRWRLTPTEKRDGTPLIVLQFQGRDSTTGAGAWKTIASYTTSGQLVTDANFCSGVYYTASPNSCTKNAFTIIQYNTKESDTDNAVTTGSGWRMTCPIGKGGLYVVAASVSWDVVATAGTGILAVFKNGSEHRRLNRGLTSTTQGSHSCGSTIVSLSDGDYFNIQGFHNSTVDETPESLATANWVSFHRLPNTTAFSTLGMEPQS